MPEPSDRPPRYLEYILGGKINLSSIPAIVVRVTDMLATGNFRLPADTGGQLIAFFLYFSGALCAAFVRQLTCRAKP